MKNTKWSVIYISYTFTVTLPIKTLSYEIALRISKGVLSDFKSEKFDAVLLLYSRFQSVLVQNPTEHRLIPASLDQTDIVAGSYDYEPEKDEIHGRGPTCY